MKKDIAKSLLEINAISLCLDPPFQWASGRFSPIYCDNRLIMSYPDLRRNIARAFAKTIESAGWAPDVIGGTATAGIPHAAWVADLLNLPMVYVRGSSKQHGKGNRIEGRLIEGERVVLIEDLISTGGSSLDAARALRESGAHLLGIVAIFTYGLDVARERFAKEGVPWETLCDFETLKSEAIRRGTLREDSRQILAEWQRDPKEWSVARGGAG